MWHARCRGKQGEGTETGHTEASVKPQGGREHVIRDFAKRRVAADASPTLTRNFAKNLKRGGDRRASVIHRSGELYSFTAIEVNV